VVTVSLNTDDTSLWCSCYGRLVLLTDSHSLPCNVTVGRCPLCCTVCGLGLIWGYLYVFVCFTYLGPVWLFCVFVDFGVYSCLFWVVSTSASDCLERLVSKMTYYIMCRAGRKTLLIHPFLCIVDCVTVSHGRFYKSIRSTVAAPKGVSGIPVAS